MSEFQEGRELLEVVAAEFMERYRRGQCPPISEYTARYPDLAAEIEEVFPTIAAMERLKVRKVSSGGGRVSLGGAKLEQLGDFRILGEIGRGGMGIVYEAFQESLGRHVAVKVLPRQSLLAPIQLQRFQREAQTAARLHHTNIVPVFGVGEHDGFHYIVMQLIRGVGLDAVLARLQQAGCGTAQGDPDRPPPESELGNEVSRLARMLAEGPSVSTSAATENFAASQETTANGGPIPEQETVTSAVGSGEAWQIGSQYWRSVAQLGQQVASALHYAHAHQTLHRDIKPSNLLLDSQGVVWITDFGLAKVMEQDNVTQTGSLAGTLLYMAPEQFSGHVDARCDVYSLGLTLYEMLVLRPAFEDGNRSSLIAKITHTEPARPRKLNPRIPRDLETIVLKAIAREPRDRYQTAGDLARDLECFLEDRPILARRASSAERLWRWARRNRAVACLAASTLALLVTVAVVASVSYVRTAQANAEERLQRKKAEETTSLAIEALDSIFRQFAPDRAAPASAALVVDAEQTVTVPAQPVLSKEAAAMLEHMLAFYDRLAAQGGDDAKLRSKTAEANRRVGDIRRRLGHYEQAKAAYLHAIDLYSRLSEPVAAEPGLRTKVARIHNELGTVYDAMNDPEAGRKSHLAALAMLEATSGNASASPDGRYELARTYYFLGKRPSGQPAPPPPGQAGARDRRGGPPVFVFDPRGPWQTTRSPFPLMPGQEREEQLNRTLTLWQRLVEDDSAWPATRPGFRPDRGPRPQSGMPPPHPEMDNSDGDSLRKATELLERLVADHPSAPEYRHLLARCYREGPPPRSGGAGPELDNLHKAAVILEKLVEEYPDIADYRYDLSETYAMLGGRPPREPDAASPTAGPRSAALLEKAVAISEQLVAEHPNIPEYAVSLVNIRLRRNHSLRASDPPRAEADLRKALDLQSELASRFPENSSYKFWLAAIQESLGGLLQEQGRVAESRSALQDCIASFKAVLEKDPKSTHVRDILAKNYVNLADVDRRLGDETAAEEALRRAVELRQEP